MVSVGKFLHDLASMRPSEPEGWSNEILLEWLSETLEKHPQLVSPAYEYFKSIEPKNIVDRIVKDTVAVCLAEFDKQFHQDIYDWLCQESGWTQKDFDDFEAYRKNR
jgi:hypothetical protein